MNDIAALQQNILAKRGALEEMKARRRQLEADRENCSVDRKRLESARGESLLDGDEPGAMRILAELAIVEQRDKDCEWQLRVLAARLQTAALDLAAIELDCRATASKDAAAALNALQASLDYGPWLETRSLESVRNLTELRKNIRAQQILSAEAFAKYEGFKALPREYLVEQLLKEDGVSLAAM